MKSEELKEVLRLHKLWINGEEGGVKADLSSADLRYADMRSADLRSADLRYADLSSAALRYADMRSADLRSADLSSADLSSADLSSANLRSANLSSADMRSADLRYADLSSADLSSADLRYADMRSADLRSADLRSADLSSARYNPFAVITTAKLNGISGDLILELMRQDALICGEEKMTAWANGGNCPFGGIKMLRGFNFDEKRELWSPGKPTMNLMEIFLKYCKDAEIKLEENQ